MVNFGNIDIIFSKKFHQIRLFHTICLLISTIFPPKMFIPYHMLIRYSRVHHFLSIHSCDEIVHESLSSSVPMFYCKSCIMHISFFYVCKVAYVALNLILWQNFSYKPYKYVGSHLNQLFFVWYHKFVLILNLLKWLFPKKKNHSLNLIQMFENPPFFR